jgi:hypothetical protein
MANAVLGVLAAAFLLAAPAAAAPTLEALMADLGFTPADVQRVHAGEMVETGGKETSEREIAAALVFLVEAPPATLVSNFEAGKSFADDPNVKSVIELRGEGSLADFAKLVLDPAGDAEAKRYLAAAPGEELNLSADEIAGFAALGKSGGGKAQVEEKLRGMLLARYQAYHAKGLAGIAPYARAGGKLTQPADDFRRETQASAMVKSNAPSFHAYLLAHPAGKPPGLEERFFCIRYAMDGRPNVSLRHRLALQLDDVWVAADREFYVSHSYNDVQALAALLPVESGTVVVFRTLSI